jgi:hypothetical protein
MDGQLTRLTVKGERGVSSMVLCGSDMMGTMVGEAWHPVVDDVIDTLAVPKRIPK